MNEARIRDMADGPEVVIKLPDPVGEVFDMVTRPNGLQVGKMRVPLGVIGMIYEARPGTDGVKGFDLYQVRHLW